MPSKIVLTLLEILPLSPPYLPLHAAQAFQPLLRFWKDLMQWLQRVDLDLLQFQPFLRFYLILTVTVAGYLIYRYVFQSFLRF